MPKHLRHLQPLSGAEEKEPAAAKNYERIHTLYNAKHRGIQTWVSFEPVYDADYVYEAFKVGYIDLYRIGKLNYHPSDIDWGAFARRCLELGKQYNRRVNLKAELAAYLDKQGITKLPKSFVQRVDALSEKVDALGKEYAQAEEQSGGKSVKVLHDGTDGRGEWVK